MNNCIYRFINRDNEIIYIGKAKDLNKRLNNHNHLTEECYEERAYIEYAKFDTEYEMDFAERYYIQKINPKYNTILAGKPISFNCEDLDNKAFKIYEINQYVVENTLKQIELLKQENMFFELNTSIIELAGMFTIYKCDAFLDTSKEQKKKFKSYDKIKKWSDEFNYKLINHRIELERKYHLLDIRLTFKDIKNIGKYLNLEESEYTMELKYKEKYKEEYRGLDFIIRCV